MREFFRRYEAAIFDLDGTLADSMQVWDTVCRDWLLDLGIAPPEDLERTIAIMTLEQAARYVTGRFVPGKAPDRAIAEWEEIVCRRYRDEVSLKPGAGELVRTLAEKMPLALATSSFPAACEGFLGRHGLRACFSAVVYSGEVQRDKTHPDIYLACARRLGADPSRCVVFEDLLEAARGVRAAGMSLVAVYDSSCADWEGLAALADLAVQDLRDLFHEGTQ